MTSKKSYYVVMLMTFLVIMGSERPLSAKVSEQYVDEILLIFNQHQQAESSPKSLLNSSNTLSFYNDSLRLVVHHIDNKLRNDTLRVQTTQDLINFKFDA